MNQELFLHYFPIQNSRKITSRISSTSTRPSSRPKANGSRPQFLGGQFLALLDHYAALQRTRPFPAAIAAAASRPIRPPSPDPKKSPRKSDQRRRSIPRSRRHVLPKSESRPHPSSREIAVPAPAARRPHRDRSCCAPSKPALLPCRLALVRIRAHRSATTPDRLPPRARWRDARLPAPPDRRSRECRQYRSPSPDSHRDQAATSMTSRVVPACGETIATSRRAS